ncbi:cation-translocating P-type ATPase [bacterium]|nr:cation-translocating P-type ATPase [bacterium]
MGNIILFSPFFSTSATIILIVSIGETINGTLQKKLNSKITDLNEKKAQTANLIKPDNNIEVIPAKNLKIDDLIIVKKGGIVPADAILISDYANIDESIFNGEINYSLKTRNEIIYGGVINTSDAIKLKVVSLYKDSMINQLIKKAQRIQGAKLSVTKKIDKIAA